MSGRRQGQEGNVGHLMRVDVGYELELRGRHRVQFQNRHILQPRGELQRTWLRYRGKKRYDQGSYTFSWNCITSTVPWAITDYRSWSRGQWVTRLCRIAKQKKKVEVIVSRPKIILWKHRRANTMEGEAYTIKCLYWATRKEYRRIGICANITISWPCN